MSAIAKFSSIFYILCLFLSSTAFADAVQKHFDFKNQIRASATAEQHSSSSAQEIRTTSGQFFIGGSKFWEWLINAQKDLREKISTQVEKLHNNDTGSISIFLLICFIYGLLHALGPGHGKTIVASYFLARRGKWIQGLALGTSITTIHTLSAVVLLFILYGIAKTAVFPIFEIGRINIEKTSYLLIILTGILLIIISFRGFLKSSTKDGEGVANASWKELLWLAFITGIVPCPAVALIVFFCLLNNLPGIALLGAAAIGIGMAITNTAFGIASIFMRRGIDIGLSRFGKMDKLALYANSGISLLCGTAICLMGIMLFINVR